MLCQKEQSKEGRMRRCLFLLEGEYIYFSKIVTEKYNEL